MSSVCIRHHRLLHRIIIDTLCEDSDILNFVNQTKKQGVNTFIGGDTDTLTEIRNEFIHRREVKFELLRMVRKALNDVISSKDIWCW